MSFFTKSNGEAIEGKTSFESNGPSVIIPHGALVPVVIEGAGWDTVRDTGAERILVKTRVTEGEFQGAPVRIVLDVLADDEKRRDKMREKFATLDRICKTGIVDKGEAPTDEQMGGMLYNFCWLKMGVFTPTDARINKQTGEKEDPQPINYVLGIYAENPQAKTPGTPPRAAAPVNTRPVLRKGPPAKPAVAEDDIPY